MNEIFNVRVNKGEEVIEALTRACEERGVRNAAIVSLIGALDACCISNMPKDDATKDILKEYSEPFEFLGSGEVIDGKVHIHCTLGQESNIALAGHLHWGKVETWFVSAHLIPLE